MKIVAIVATGYIKRFLAEITDDEIAIIRRGELSSNELDSRASVGTDIRIGDHWKRVKDIDAAQERLDSAAASLRAVAELLGTIDVVVPPAAEKEEAK